MVIKEKFYPDGKFEKLKARLVAGGNQQDKNLYDDLSAPTVSTCAALTTLSAAAHEGRHTAVVDIGGAFLNADMDTGVIVHMSLDSTMSRLLTTIEPRYGKYLDPKGRLIVILNKALYGCVESGMRIYDQRWSHLDTKETHVMCVYLTKETALGHSALRQYMLTICSSVAKAS